jgi:ATP-dependent helicase/nuclease subunit A
VRLDRAKATLERWHAHEVAAADVIGACDRLYQHLETTWPKGRCRREVPIFARLGAQLVSGRIDLAVEDEFGFCIIDHKSFPGSHDHWETRASGYGPQLGLYAEALLAATGRPCERLYIHMPIVGTLLRVARHR